MARVTGHVRLVERKRGAVWYLRYRTPSGKQVQKLLGPNWPKRSEAPEGYYRRKDAEEALEDVLGGLRKGDIPDPGQRSGKTFGDAVEEWLRYCEGEGLRMSTLRDYRNTANGTLLPEFGKDTALEALDADRITAYREKALSGGKLSRRSVQKHLVMLGGIFKRARERKWIATDPTVDIKPVSVRPSGNFNVLSVQQVELVARSCEDPMHQAAIIVAAYTGLRTGELRALRWRDVDFAAATIHVRANMPAGGEEAPPKSGKVRSVPLMDDAARELDALSRRPNFTSPDDRVFPGSTGAMLGEDALRDALYAALEAAGIDRTEFPARGGFTFHDLRHTFGTLAVQVWPLSDVQEYMGHADIQTTMRYSHHIPKVNAAREFTEAITRMKAASDLEQTVPPTVPPTAPTEAR